MSRWPWRRRAAAWSSTPESAPAAEAEPAPEPASEPAAEAVPESEPAAEAAPESASEASGGISAARLDEALKRLRERTPAREDGPGA